MSKKKAKFTPEYFINKFEAIPEENWRTGSDGWTTEGPCRCVLGHLGEGVNDFNGSGGETKESRAYKDLVLSLGDGFGWQANDGTPKFKDLGDSPKERVINALTLVASGALQDVQ